MTTQPWTRRRFLAGSVFLTALPLVATAAPEAVLVPLPADAEQATALGYRASSANVSDPAYVAGSHCGTCQFHQPDGGCPVFPGFRVSSTGWCRVWSAPEAAAAPSRTVRPSPP